MQDIIYEVEGADLVGKTTLCKSIGKFLKLESKPIDIFDPNFSFVSLGACFGIAEYVKSFNLRVLIDRFMLSNYVYERVLPEREIAITDDTLIKFYQTFRTKTLIIILEEEELRRRFDERGDEYLKFKYILKANDLFEELYDKLKINFPNRFFADAEKFKKEVKL